MVPETPLADHPWDDPRTDLRHCRSAQFQWTGFATNWVVPFGDIFMNLLKLIAVPLVLTSLVAGVASLSDFKKLSRMGSKTIGLYIATTAVAVTIGLLVVNVLQPGAKLPDATKAKLEAQFQANAADKAKGDSTEAARQRGPLQPLVDMVPDNFFGSASSNRNMLQLVFVSLLIGISLVQVSSEHRKPVLSLFEGMQAVVIKLVNMIMLMAPIGVFALITKTITSLAIGEGRPSRPWANRGGTRGARLLLHRRDYRAAAAHLHRLPWAA